MKQFFPQDIQIFFKENLDNIVYKDKLGNSLNKGSLVIYSERADGKYNYADSLGQLSYYKKIPRMTTIIFNNNGYYKELRESQSDSDSEIFYHSLNFYKKDNLIEVHIADLELVPLYLESTSEMISYMNRHMPLNGISN